MVKQFLAFLLLFVFAPPAFADAYKVESIGPLTETKIAEPIRKSVAEKGLRVTDDKGKTICEIWLSKEVAVGKDEIPGAMFGQIPEGTLIGIINFPAVIDALADIGFDQWAQLETSCPSKNIAADFKRNKQFVDDLIGKRNRTGSAAKA